jgi:hypothetical protein
LRHLDEPPRADFGRRRGAAARCPRGNPRPLHQGPGQSVGTHGSRPICASRCARSSRLLPRFSRQPPTTAALLRGLS